MNKATKTLFGGALLTAGMTTGALASPEFTQPGNIPPYADDFTSGYVYNYYVGIAGGQTVNGGFGSSYSISNIDGSASGSISSTLLSASADATNNGDAYGGFAFGDAYGYLSVTEDAAVNLAWDFTAEGAGGPLGEIQIVDWSSGGVLVFASDPFTAGTATVALAAGTNYGILVRANAGPGGTAFASAELVPTPGAMGLLGAAGLLAVRRRR
ncbi:MAG: hypothetical protein AAF356_01085 [Planctomycetota bacterium]